MSGNERKWSVKVVDERRVLRIEDANGSKLLLEA